MSRKIVKKLEDIEAVIDSYANDVIVAHQNYEIHVQRFHNGMTRFRDKVAGLRKQMGLKPRVAFSETIQEMVPRYRIGPSLPNPLEHIPVVQETKHVPSPVPFDSPVRLCVKRVYTYPSDERKRDFFFDVQDPIASVSQGLAQC